MDEKKPVFKRGFIAVTGLLFIIVLFQNLEPSSIKFLFWSFTAPKLVMYLVMASIGAALGIWSYKKSVDIDEFS